jgi:hydroxymethylpyrimidine/phosphomethylpyrimidine kinase
MAVGKKQSIALTIAGSDSGGGAGIQADLKTFAAWGVHGTSAITCVTAQNPRRVRGIESGSPQILRRQIQAVFEELPPRAVKTGMLFSAENVRATAVFLKNKKCPLVVDPVMIATSGAMLLDPAAKKALLTRLLPLATLITPNLDEVGAILEWKPGSIGEMRAAARALHERFGCAVLVKGGHLARQALAVDIYFDGKNEMELSAPFVRGIATHGTGCTYSAAICAALALGHNLPAAVEQAKRYITQAIAGSRKAGKHFILGIPGWPNVPGHENGGEISCRRQRVSVKAPVKNSD